jgi:hypothetical protein
MSIRAMNYAWDQAAADMPSGALFVLIVLGDHAGDHSGEDWRCYPSVDRICGRTHLKRGAVERHLALLVAEGWISRARRVRPDGKLSFYDYEVHRDPGLRARLKAARAAILAGGERPSEEVSDLDHPCAKLEHGPCADLGAAMLQFEALPCSKMEHQESPEEPSREPTTRAREPGDDGFEEAIQTWPDSGLKRTSWPAARAKWAWACGQVGGERMLQAVKRCAADPDLARGDYGWPGFHTWLEDERWRNWLPAERSEAASKRTPFVGPPEVLEAIVGAIGPSLAQAFLDGATFREADRTVLTRTATAATRLADELGWSRCKALNLRFERAAALAPTVPGVNQ